MKRSILLLLSVSAFFSAGTAGIMRHDAPKDKYLALAADSGFACAGQVLRDGSTTGGGSCVLIGERYVLTAAHMVTDATRRGTAKREELQAVAAESYTVRFGERVYAVRKVIVHPAYLDSATRHTCDIAVLELSENVSVRPAVLNTLGDEHGEVVVGVGFGASGSGKDAASIQYSGERIAGENTIDSLGGYLLDGKPTLLFADFDYPISGRLNTLGADAALPLEYMTTGGDSGGPLFCKRGAAYELVGLCSGSHNTVNYGGPDPTGYYGSISYWTRISVFADWIKAQVK